MEKHLAARQVLYGWKKFMSHVSAFTGLSASLSPISGFHTLLLPNLLQKLFLGKSPWHSLFIKSCCLPHSPVMLEQCSYSPREHLPSLISSFNSLRKCYFFNTCLPCIVCSSFSATATRMSAHLSVTSPLNVTSPLHWATESSILVFLRKPQDRKQQQTPCICGH